MTRRMKLIFTLSLLLNILLIGTGAGLFYKFCQDGPIPPDLSPEARHFMARTFQEGRATIKPLITDIKKDRKALEAVIAADTFDRAAYDEGVAKVLDTKNKIGKQRADIIGAALMDLPAADRQKFARRILDGLTDRPPPKGGFHNKMMKDGKDRAFPGNPPPQPPEGTVELAPAESPKP